jgi:hypothetical protein
MNYLRCSTSGAAGYDLGTTIKFLRAAAGIGLGNTIKYLRGAAGIGIGTTIKYVRHSTSGAAGDGLRTVIKYLRGAAGINLGTMIKYLRRVTYAAADSGLGTTFKFLVNPPSVAASIVNSEPTPGHVPRSVFVRGPSFLAVFIHPIVHIRPCAFGLRLCLSICTESHHR